MNPPSHRESSEHWRFPDSCDFLLRSVRSWEDFREMVNRLGKSKLANKRKGDVFERLVQLFLQHTPDYKLQLEVVWLYTEIPAELKRALNLPDKDRGVDLLARTKGGDYWAIQAKYRSDRIGAIPMGEMATFGMQAAAVAKGISRGLICATKREKTPDFADATFDFQHVLLDTWETLPAEFWASVRQASTGREVESLEPRSPRSYQFAAVDAAIDHFVELGKRRGKLIMPCGTGKSLMGYWTAVDALGAKTIVVAVPSLDLIRQTFADWAREAIANRLHLDPLIVCSDKSTTSEGDVHTNDLPCPVTTDPVEIRAWLNAPVVKDCVRVVFTTYQSGKVFADAAGRFQFDVGIFDEAHKTAGYEGKANQHLLHQKNLRIHHRVFMTATERYYDGESDEVVGMNDRRVYGDRYHYMSFGEAIREGILANYSVVLMVVSKSEAEDYRRIIDERIYVEPGLGQPSGVGQAPERLTAENLATAVALRKAIQKYRLRHAISFHARNRYAKEFVAVQEALNGAGLSGRLKTYRVSSELSAGRRHEEIEGFEKSDRALISNARCLTEGVDVPGIDLVLFAQPRQSKVDIVQAVGRALRKPPDQPEKRGYVLVPVLVDDNHLGLEEIVKGTGFENIVSVLKAMATVDTDVIDRISVVLGEGAKKARKSSVSDTEAEEVVPEVVELKDFAEAIRLRAWDRLEGLIKPRLTVEQILEWADAFHERTGKWPRLKSGAIRASSEETWAKVNKALERGFRSLPGGSSLAKLLAEERGLRNPLGLPSLDEQQILRWADAHHERTGEWPQSSSGAISDAVGENWKNVDAVLRQGLRGLPGGLSLPKLLAEKRGVRNQLDLPSLEEQQILDWADEHHERTGKWPVAESGVIDGALGERWMNVNAALSMGLRDLPGGSSLAKLLAEERGARNRLSVLKIAVEQILDWADAFHERTGTWPKSSSGDIEGEAGETWAKIDKALLDGLRGLPGGSSLVKLLAEERGVRNKNRPPPLTKQQILNWADEHHERTGEWPKVNSGEVFLAPEESWKNVNQALMRPSRGFTGISSLAKLFAEYRSVPNVAAQPPLAIEQILAWADAHHQRTGKWPINKSGAISDSPGEKWIGVCNALRKGRRGLSGGSSLAKLLAAEREVRNKQGLSLLTEKQILAWADAHNRRTGEWPRQKSGAIREAAGEKWLGIDASLSVGRRGLPGGSSLAKLLATERGARNAQDLPPLTEGQILEWADAHHRRTGKWPNASSGAVYGTHDENWSNINGSLLRGRRGLSRSLSLAKLLQDKFAVRNKKNLPSLSEKQILQWAKTHQKRTESWPSSRSGGIPEAPGETWSIVNCALYEGIRGLPGGSSLHQLLVKTGLKNS